MSERATVIDLTTGLQPPTADQARALREGAGLSLAQIAAVLAIGNRGTWARYERGERDMPLQTWALALLAAGQHPRYSLADAPGGPQALRSGPG